MSTVRLVVPHQDRTLLPPAADRVRRLKRHLVASLRDLQRTRRPDRLVERPVTPPPSEAVPVLQAGCAACRGLCCLGGEEHAYLDERTLARVRRARPELTGRGMIAAYLERVAPLSFAGSCLFHGEAGCTLPPGLRARLCHSFFCTPLRDFLHSGLTGPAAGEAVTVVPGPAGWDGGRAVHAPGRAPCGEPAPDAGPVAIQPPG